MADDIPALVQGGAITAAIGAVGLWLANRMAGKAAVQAALNQGFEKLYTELHAQLVEERKQRNADRIRYEATTSQLQGEINNLTQALESLKHELRRHNIPIPLLRSPPPASGFIVLEQEALDDDDESV